MVKGIEGNLTLIILDGVGEVDREIGNAVRQARMPVLNRLRAGGPYPLLKAHGTYVGLPSDDDMGNSEVGHNALGAGRIYDQGAKLINQAIESGRLFEGDEWRRITDRLRSNGGALHFLGLLSDGNVHSHINHLLAMLEGAARDGLKRVRLHILLDGRDVGGTTALVYVDQLEQALAGFRASGLDYKIASGGGRMLLTMDRYEADWDMVEAGWRHHVQGLGRRFASAGQAIETYRRETPNLNDQYIPGFVIAEDDKPVGPILDGDGVILFNFRGDRAIEISRAFEEGDSFTAFDRGEPRDIQFAGMMQYDGDLMLPKHFLVGPPRIKGTLSEFLVDHRITQFAISETQKYGHVTYFWNGNRSSKFNDSLETYVEIPSDRVSFDERPWMKAAEITDSLIRALREGNHRFLRVNYANGDMVGHTGNLEAAVLAMSCLDLQLGRLLSVVKATGGVAMITADHGNADEMFDIGKDGSPVPLPEGGYKPKTSHTLNPVPFLIYDPHQQMLVQPKGNPEHGLANVAGTVAETLGLQPPKEWNESLLRWERE